ncbi:hypothetical protein CEP52_005072 [Fusarium oligoseptatum]|uniref:Uncharacterized protein n=1 Tax=Fusarium oligoseptatum TaxID=2604345 RepID=A0A428U0I5_9HYPO|nr:hypothetical protein CEP52_005072 [Fusarium oligoseptatum]
MSRISAEVLPVLSQGCLFLPLLRCRRHQTDPAHLVPTLPRSLSSIVSLWLATGTGTGTGAGRPSSSGFLSSGSCLAQPVGSSSLPSSPSSTVPVQLAPG